MKIKQFGTRFEECELEPHFQRSTAVKAQKEGTGFCNPLYTLFSHPIYFLLSIISRVNLRVGIFCFSHFYFRGSTKHIIWPCLVVRERVKEINVGLELQLKHR